MSIKSVVAALAATYPDRSVFMRKEIMRLEGFDQKILNQFVYKNAEKVGYNRYDVSRLLETVAPATPASMVTSVASITNDEVFVPAKDPNYVRFGAYKDIEAIIKSEAFFPVYITGLSGNGKTVMVEQACARAKREYVRVQITPETDEDDLIGGFRLINGETVFQKGPVVKAMETGAILLIDELDRGSNQIMCLQGVLEGKPVLLKKTGQVVTPAKGFNILATTNTKGRGSNDGRFSAATIVDEAFLERFTITVEQEFPTAAIERKILSKMSEETDFIAKLVDWACAVRKTYNDDGIDEVISTRRLIHIIRTFEIFQDRMKSIELCISRFDTDTKEALLDLYTKVDADVTTDEPQSDDDNPF